jgi:hypothetical protein
MYILTYPDLFRVRHVLFFVDNTSAMSAAIHGYTASPSMVPLSNAIQIALASLQSKVRFEYVPSKANPADIPSRVHSQWTVAILRALGVEDRKNWREFVQPAMNSLIEPKSAMGFLARMCE